MNHEPAPLGSPVSGVRIEAAGQRLMASGAATVRIEPPLAELIPVPADQERAAAGAGNAAVAPDASGGEEYFDIPAFLRRQAD